MRTSLQVAGRTIESAFDLVGQDEDSISRAIAWGLRQSPEFLARFLRLAISWRRPLGDVQLSIHQHDRKHGITDLEVVQGDDFHLIVEAKRGWVLPNPAQLEKYSSRASFRNSSAALRTLVTLSECSQEYALARGISEIRGIPVRHIAWADLAVGADSVGHASGVHNRHLLLGLAHYLRSQMSTQDQYSNQVFVVSLGSETPAGWSISLVDIVRKRHRYFHPVGNRWPPSPPNYIGFRYGGRLQSVHHIEKHSVIDDLSTACAGIPSPCRRGQHYLYRLGPAIVPAKPVKTGKIRRSGHVWCALDLLLTSGSISAARDASKRREKVARASLNKSFRA